MAIEDTKEEKKNISKHDFYIETPLYEVILLSELEKYTFEGEVDAYSAKNYTETTYSINTNEIYTWSKKDDERNRWVNIGFFAVNLTCKRKENDILRFFIYKDLEIAMKVGQWPSLADLQFAEINKKYDGVLPKDDLKNLKRAIGLAANGIGAGSFVYLRRIFENLILETFKNNFSHLSIKEADFKVQRMEDKVITLKLFLPSQLVEMKSIYKILSTGVHELSEVECLKYFNPIKLSIELILDQKIEEAKKHQRDAAVKKQLQDIHQELAGENSK